MLQVAAQTFASLPEGNMQYDIIGMLNYIFKLKGIKDLDKFKLTPEQQQQRMQMLAAKTAAETPPQAPTQQPSQGA
jgi:adenylate kinase